MSNPDVTRDNATFHIVLAQAVAFKDGKALIAQRGMEEVQSPGMWSIPGGKVELYGKDDNVIEKTLKAEFEEEVGIELHDEMNYCQSSSFIRKDDSSVIVLCFIADWKAGEAQPLEDSIAVAWISREEIGNYEYPPTIKETLESAFERRES
jgi:ADP-ribose pyrophosphatase YjhB (NUDIX family)